MDEKTTPTGQNPFNLIDQDIANQENTTQNVSTTPTTNDVPVTNNTEVNPAMNTSANNAPKKDLFEEIIRKAAKFFAKIMWQPDPETWAPANSTATDTSNTQQPTTNTENQWNTENTTPQKIDFNSVMSGVTGFMDKVWQSKIVWNVTWFLDKVWDKIEEKTWINLDSPAPAPGTTNTQPVETQAVTTSTEQTTVAPVQPTESAQLVQPVQQPTQPIEPVQQVAPVTTPETPVTQQ